MVENKVKERRIELGMTLKELAKEGGLPVSTLNDIERGSEPKVKTAQRIANALFTEINDLWPE